MRVSVLRVRLVTVYGKFSMGTTAMIIRMFGHSASATLTMSEFEQLCTYVNAWKDMFNETDSDHTRSISFQELSALLKRMGYTLSPQTLARVWLVYDDDRSGSLTFDEFIMVGVVCGAVHPSMLCVHDVCCMCASCVRDCMLVLLRFPTAIAAGGAENDNFCLCTRRHGAQGCGNSGLQRVSAPDDVHESIVVCSSQSGGVSAALLCVAPTVRRCGEEERLVVRAFKQGHLQHIINRYVCSTF